MSGRRRFVVDFYCAEARLVIEVDGPVHQYTAQEDATRQEFLESLLRLTVIRVTNDEVTHSLEAVLDRLEQLTATLGAHQKPRTEHSR